MSKNVITVDAGRPYGHCAGHSYYDVSIDFTRRGRVATLTITWGSSQGSYLQEHGRVAYSRRGSAAAEAVELVRDEAIKASEDDELRRYIETAASRALLMLAKRVAA